MKIAIARPYNAYGPRDGFDPERSHVIPALIKRLYDGEHPLRVWGDGTQSRSFLYVTDFARGLLELTERYPVADPVNLGTQEEITIRDLVDLLVAWSGQSVTVEFDASKPSGQSRRSCDTSKAEQLIGYKAHVSLKEGLTSTIAGYEQHYLSPADR